MDTWERFMKYLLFTVNVVILIFAILVIIVSLYGLVKEGYFIFIICALIGILMMSVAILGIVAAMRKSKCMLLTYAIIAIVLAPLIMIEMIGHPFQHSTEIAIIATLIGLLVLGKISAFVLYRS